MPLFETPETARARVRAALRLTSQLDRFCLHLQTGIDDVTSQLEQIDRTLDELRLQDLGLSEIEQRLMAVREGLIRLGDELNPEVDDDG